MHNHEQLLVKDFMQAPPVTLLEDQSVEEIVLSLRERGSIKKIMYFYVVDKNNSLEGIISTLFFALSKARRTSKRDYG